MKYGESSFDILYLLFAVISGCVMLYRAKDKTEKLMGLSALILGCGDAFHLVPRVLNYFSDADLTAALGAGKLVTSVTMTVFYLLLYYVWLGHYEEREKRGVTALLWILCAVRVVLCLFPQNGWFYGTYLSSCSARPSAASIAGKGKKTGSSVRCGCIYCCLSCSISRWRSAPDSFRCSAC